VADERRSAVTTGQFLWGLSNGVTVLAIAGGFWLGFGLGQPAWAAGFVPWLLVTLGMFIGPALIIRSALRLRRRSGFRRSDLRRSDPETQRILRGFRTVGLLQTVIVGAAVWLCVHFRREDLIWPAIGVGVSVHFAPLAKLFAVPEYYATAGLGALVSIVALVAPLGSSRLVVLGAGMSAVMWGSAIYLLQSADAIATRALADASQAVRPR
jgi:hypothetical protein